MTNSGKVRRLRDLFGAWSVVSILQALIIEPIVIAAWGGTTPYNPLINVLSDLGAAHCGMHRGREVCSPLYWLMDGSFVLQGVGMLLGAMLMGTLLVAVGGHPERTQAPQVTEAKWARVTLGVCGVSAIGVGLVPEDVLSWLHYAAATIFFVAGCVTLFLLFAIWLRSSAVAWVLLVLAVLASAGSVTYTVFGVLLDVPGFYGGLVERVVVYSIVFGFAVMGATIALGVRRQRLLLIGAAAKIG